MSFTTVTVTETFKPKAPGGATPTGSVTFQLDKRIHDGSGNEANPEPITATLDGSGAISQGLYANDDTATVPSDSRYLVRVDVDGQPEEQFYIRVPHTAASGTATLSSLS